MTDNTYITTNLPNDAEQPPILPRNFLPIAVLIACLAAMLASVVWASGKLPAKVASHFNGVGQPDDTMLRDNYLLFMTAIGIGLPLFMVGVFYSIRFFPPAIVNMPNRDYWLAPERRLATAQTMLTYGLWLASAESVFLTLIHLQVVQANLAQPVRLTNLIWVQLFFFLAFVAVWLVALFRQFRMPV
jgi:hypothetical protein